LIYETAKIIGRDELVMGENSSIGDFCFINASGGIRIGECSHIHAGSRVIGGAGLYLGDHSAVTYDVLIVTATDRPNGLMSDHSPMHLRRVDRKAVFIGDYVYIGSKSVIMPGVTIGNGAVIWSQSYVDKNIPAWEIWGGRPAVFKRKRMLDDDPYSFVI